jgi:hypothetical protein
MYIGTAIGQSRIEADAPSYTDGDSRENHAISKVMIGIRRISLIGAEFCADRDSEDTGSGAVSINSTRFDAR